MKFRLTLILSLIVVIASCKSTPAEIPLGTWNYDLIVNGVKAGKASVTSEKNNNTYITTSEMSLKVGPIENKSIQVVKESADFKPVSLDVTNTIYDSSTNKKQEIKKSATFNGQKVTLTTGEYKSEFTIDKPFVLEGNFFFSELIKNKFKEGTVVKAYIYEPTVEIEEPILVIVEVQGYKDVDINGKVKKLLLLKQKVEKLKSLDVYINNEGVTEKVVIKMLNNIFELVKAD
ncbi:MAG TPA: hypothetical protein PLN03_00075 [Spirochaetota bacterium]|nr:hypothetical protein [Spirochaetota bacterium]HOK91200.1 hypothetical protein [Spirochaetota bacterium]